MPDWTSFDAFLAETEQAENDAAREALVEALLAERQTWPWIEGRTATFALTREGTNSAALNLDTLPGDPPFAPMTNIPGTRLWYVTQDFQADDLLDYMIAIDDPMTPLAQERDLAARVATHWGTDALNPLKMETAQMDVSVLRMPQARPFPDWSALAHVPRGRIYEYTIASDELSFDGRKLWVYTPPNFSPSTVYPLLILQDGQWAAAPLQVPQIADALIKHQRMMPVLIAMLQSGEGAARDREYFAGERYSVFLLTELLPYLQTRYSIDGGRIGIGGVDDGAFAAMSAAIRSPSLFSRLMAISPPLGGKGSHADELRDLMGRYDGATTLPKRIFQSVGRYEAKSRFVKPARALHDRLQTRRDAEYKFIETGSGHGLVGFRSVIPEALAFLYPGAAFG
jgi:enterochelin esterase-like enzyme